MGGTNSISPVVQSPSAWGKRPTLAGRLHPTTSSEATSGEPIDDQGLPPGDPRRSAHYTSPGWVDFGDVPTFVDGDTITLPGDLTGRYTKFSRCQLSSETNGKDYGRVQVVSYDLGDDETTIEFFWPPHGGAVYADIFSIALQLAAVTNEENTFRLNHNSVVSQFFINQSIGDAAGSGISIGDTEGAAVALRVTGANYDGQFLTGGSLDTVVALHTGNPIPIDVGVGDRCRVTFNVATEPTVFQGANEGVRLVSEDDSHSGNCWLGLYRYGGLVRKARIGFDGSTNNLRVANDETGAVVIDATAGGVALLASNNTFTLNNVEVHPTASPPNGVVTAPPGSLALHTGGGASTTLYVKESGVGNTGWVAK